MHTASLIRDLAVILGVAAAVTFLFRRIRQPVVLGYVLSGFLIGPYTPPFPLVSDLPNIKVLAELGIVFLMFSLGLEFSFHKLKRVGSAAIGTASFEVVGMVGLGMIVGQALGWRLLDSMFLGGMVAISSTTILIKALEELELRTRRFAELVFGVLVVEDLFAVLILAALSTLGAGKIPIGGELLFSALKLILVVGSWFVVGYFLIPSLIHYLGKYLDNETLTISSCGLCLLLVVLAMNFGYSSALGAFIMGSILAETIEANRIVTLIHPLKDLFAAVFFVSVGMLVDPLAVSQNIVSIGVVTLTVIVGKIIFPLIGALMMGQPLKRSLQAGFTLAQIGEFSFIIAGLGATVGLIEQPLYAIAVSVSVFTTFLTPYFIRVSQPCAIWLENSLPAPVAAYFNRYVQWSEQPRRGGSASHFLVQRTMRLLLNAIVVTLIFLTVSQWGLPKLTEWFPRVWGWNVLSWLISIVFSAPFVWGMFFAFRPLGEADGTGMGFSSAWIFFGQLITVIWIGVLSNAFFTTFASSVMILVSALIVFFAFYRWLEASYKWFEKRFLANIKARHDPDINTVVESFAPWDLHLVRLRVHPNASLAGQALKEADIRSRYGLNVVVIQRGRRVIASPGANDKIFPGDDILVLGTDPQIDQFRTAVELPSDPDRIEDVLSRYALKRMLVTEDSPFVGQTIRDAKIREKLNGLVVGLERENLRTINPDPAYSLKLGDVLWIVGGVT